VKYPGRIHMKIIHSLFLTAILLFSVSAFAEKININTASAQQLATVMTGIGENKAQAIIEYREKHGDFKTIESLQNVDGIGEKTIEKNRDRLSL
jgi:competence protein ComEA